MIVGLTGGIASGKSSISSQLVRMDFLVIDADVLAREVVQPGTDGLQEVIATFGIQVLLVPALRLFRQSSDIAQKLHLRIRQGDDPLFRHSHLFHKINRIFSPFCHYLHVSFSETCGGLGPICPHFYGRVCPHVPAKF